MSTTGEAVDARAAAAAPVNEGRLQQAVSDARAEILGDITAFKQDVADKLITQDEKLETLDRNIEKEKLDREYKGMEGEFRVTGYSWTLSDLGRPGTAARRRFVSNLIRKVFVNQELLDQETATATPIADLRPIGWRDNNPLIVKFLDLMVAHGIKERLPKLPNLPSTIKVREMRPIILDSMYNDLLRIRRALRDENTQRTIYIEERSFLPYLSLVEKSITDGVVYRTRPEFAWSDPRFEDPIIHHDAYAREFRARPAGLRNQSNNGRGGTQRGRGSRGGNRGRGGRGGHPSGPTTRSQQSQHQALPQSDQMEQ